LIGNNSHSIYLRFLNHKVEKAQYITVIVGIKDHGGGRDEAGAGIVGASIGVIVVYIGDLHVEVLGKRWAECRGSEDDRCLPDVLGALAYQDAGAFHCREGAAAEGHVASLRIRRR
jgi:hypothetical protein